ncbi:sodium:calcium antiporter [Halorhabdus rudnickae]|uniref:sodium:calcium antiporter n=1 Tax=Halorhabdus rudnickae TaxID=1775544 RepID=UPI001083091C|nr:sodium:calcium antiporter [Halorhabdus rudnickae]
MSRLRHPLTAVAAAVALTIPWVVVELSRIAATLEWMPIDSGIALSTELTVLVTGLAVVGASFLLAWGAETAEKDVPRAFALAVLAVLAVAPEYAVDAFYAWNAGAQSGTAAGAEAGNLAIANMTGANRILIGLGWSGIALFTVYRAYRVRDESVEFRDGFLADIVTLDKALTTEITFLWLATLWAFLVPLGGGIDLIDTVVLVGLYVSYILIIIRSGIETEEEQIGVPGYLQAYRKPKRIATVMGLFIYSGIMILIAVEPFAHGLEELGLQYGVPKFFMIQWIAPLASESPELIVVVYLVNKARSSAGFNALISSKLNQWTLLIGTLAVVYSVAQGGLGTLAFDYKQSLEIWITAAQSFFALAILVNFNISLREAVGLLVLFVSQVVAEFVVLNVLSLPNPEAVSHQILLGYTAVYVLIGLAMFLYRRQAVKEMLAMTYEVIQTAFGRRSDFEIEER